MSGIIGDNTGDHSGQIATVQGVTTSSGDPAIDTNPSGGIGTVFVNTTSGEMYACTDATAGANVWTNVGDGTGDIIPTIPSQGTISGYMHGGYFAGVDNVIDKWSFSSDGNATDVGDSTYDHYGSATSSDRGNGYGYCCGSSGPYVDHIERVSYTSDGNATDHSNLLAAKANLAGHTSELYGFASGGSAPAQNVIQKWQFSTTNDSTDVCDLASAQQMVSGGSSETHGYTSGGYNTNMIQKFSFSSTDNATDIANLTEIKAGSAATDSSTHGYHAGGDRYDTPSNVVDKHSFSSDDDSTDVGDLTVITNHMVAGQSSTTHGYNSGGNSNSNVISKRSYASDGNDSDVGDLTQGRNFAGGNQY